MARKNTDSIPKLDQYNITGKFVPSQDTEPPKQALVTKDNVIDIITDTLGNSTIPIRIKSNFIESANFITGSSGWRLDDNGNLEANNGNFRGNITGASGTFSGSLSGASFVGGSVSYGKTGFSDDTNAGYWLGNDSGAGKLNIGSSSSKYLHYDGTNFELKGGTIRGNDIYAAADNTTSNVHIFNQSGTYPGGEIEFLYNNVQQAFMACGSDGALHIEANQPGSSDNSIYLKAAKDVHIASGNSNDNITLISTGYIQLQATGNIYTQLADQNLFYSNNQTQVQFNYNGGTDNVSFFSGAPGGQTEEFRVQSDGNIYSHTAFHNGGIDFAELFESLDGNKIPDGTSVSFVGDKIRPSLQGEIPIGVISACPTVVGNSSMEWNGKYIKDDFGRTITEEVEHWHLKSDENRKIGEENYANWSDIVSPPENAILEILKREKINPLYDSTKEYIPRTERPEWNTVGLIGRLRLRKGQPVAPSWIKIKDINENVEEYLIK